MPGLVWGWILKLMSKLISIKEWRKRLWSLTVRAHYSYMHTTGTCWEIHDVVQDQPCFVWILTVGLRGLVKG